jgi:predicted nucleotidyltransferase
VAALYLYGSYARDEARPDSDLDVLIDLEPGPPRGLREFMAPQLTLEAAFPGVEIGCSTRDGLHPLYRPHIEPTLVRVF